MVIFSQHAYFPLPNAMKTSLSWLHVSDIHFHPKTGWRDNLARQGLIALLRDVFKNDETLRPDLIFCTGDIAFGEATKAPLSDQYNDARHFFDELLDICGRGTPLPKERLFVVPGNHDINRTKLNADAQATLVNWAKEAARHVDEINVRFENRPIEFQDAMRRLEDYGTFVADYLPQQNDEGRHVYGRIVEVDGLKVGVAGFNSAWSCAGPEDDRAVWLPAEWQFNEVRKAIADADVRIGLIHHPLDWLDAADHALARERVSTDLHFLLHGHTHDAWVDPRPTHVTVAAGAIGADASEEFGVNLVRLNLATREGEVHLYERRKGAAGWVIAPVVGHAPNGVWTIDVPKSVKKVAATAASPASEVTPEYKSKIYGRTSLLREADARLQARSTLLVYGLRGNGKSTVIEELMKAPHLAEKPRLRFTASQALTPEQLFLQIAPLLGDTSENPSPPSGDAAAIELELRRRYGAIPAATLWIDHAHLLIHEGFSGSALNQLLRGLRLATKGSWHFIFELRERPSPGLLASDADECEVPGLDKASLAKWFEEAAPVGQEAGWKYSGHQLNGMYQWLGGGHGNQAHAFATRLLVEVAYGRKETPREVLERHRGDVGKAIEARLLGDLFNNVLNADERRMLTALSLYRVPIPHDHADILEEKLKTSKAWLGLDRRLLLVPAEDHSLYYLHSFISAWVRTSVLGYASEDHDLSFSSDTAEAQQRLAHELHAAIAGCWLEQLGERPRITNVNIQRSLEAFHHMTIAGDVSRVSQIAVELLGSNIEWARQRMRSLYEHQFKTRAPNIDQLRTLQYRALLEPTEAAVYSFLGHCWKREDGSASRNALECFETACRLRPNFARNWSDLGTSLLAQGRAGAVDFIARVEELKSDRPEAIDDHVRAVEAACRLKVGDAATATTIRLASIHSGSRNPAFYADEAMERVNSGDAEGALEILDLAEKNGAANDYIAAIRANVLQQSDPAKASALRMANIDAGSKISGLYADEARARADAGDAKGAVEILDLAERNGVATEYFAGIRARIEKFTG